MGDVDARLVRKNKDSIGRNGMIRITNKNTRLAQSTDGSQREFSLSKTNTQAVKGYYNNNTPSQQILLNSREEEAVLRQQELSLQYKKLKQELE